MTVRRQEGNQTDTLRDESAEGCENQSPLEEGGCTAYMKNTSKTVHIMLNIWYMGILVYMWNVPKVHVSAMKTQWKHMKTLAKLCISCIIYCTCVFWYKCEMYQKYMFLQRKHSENTWKHMKTHENTRKTVYFMYNILYMCILIYIWNVPKVHVSAVKTQWKHMKTHKNTWKH
jgi:hypothetical protein